MPMPVGHGGQFMETYETWLAKSISGRGLADGRGRKVNWGPGEIVKGKYKGLLRKNVREI